MSVVGNLFGLLMGPGGKVLAIILAFAAWTAYQRIDATRDCKESEYLAQVEEANRQMQLSRNITEDAIARATETEEQLRQLREQTDALITDIKSSGSSCTISPDLRERLLRIR